MKIEEIDINLIKPYKNNPREISQEAVDKVKKSIKEFGNNQPIVVDQDNIIVVGHTRYKALKGLNKTKAFVIKKNFEKNQAIAYRIMDNRSGEESKWETKLLKQELAILQDEDFDLNLSGFNILELENMGFDSIKLDSINDSSEKEDENNSFSFYSKSEIIQDCFDFYRHNGFPYRNLPLHLQKQKLNSLYDLEGEQLVKNSICSDVADTYHKHRYTLNAIGMKSPLKAYNRDIDLKKAIRIEIESGAKLKGEYFATLSLVNGTQACSNFRPAFAKYLYDRFCNKDSIVLDTSTGFGGRLLGAMCSKKVSKYIGIDPSIKTHNANIKMSETLGFKDKVELINLPAEDVDIDKYKKSVNFSFTSPPYFVKEEYADEETQSFKRYSQYQDWIDKFLKKMILLQYSSLKNNSYNLINIADVKIKGHKYDLVEKTLEIAKNIGFHLQKKEEYSLHHRFGTKEKSVAQEALLIFKKN